jgi:hypothetical protein
MKPLFSKHLLPKIKEMFELNDPMIIKAVITLEVGKPVILEITRMYEEKDPDMDLLPGVIIKE